MPARPTVARTSHRAIIPPATTAPPIGLTSRSGNEHMADSLFVARRRREQSSSCPLRGAASDNAARIAPGDPPGCFSGAVFAAEISTRAGALNSRMNSLIRRRAMRWTRAWIGAVAVALLTAGCGSSLSTPVPGLSPAAEMFKAATVSSAAKGYLIDMYGPVSAGGTNGALNLRMAHSCFGRRRWNSSHGAKTTQSAANQRQWPAGVEPPAVVSPDAITK